MGNFKKKCILSAVELVPHKYVKILEDYWSFNGDTFKNKPCDVAEKHDLNSVQLFEIAKIYSDVKIYDHCGICGMEMMTEVENQLEFLETYKNPGGCEKCFDMDYIKHLV
ncbi:hypothetical protein [Maribacter forsetii]|uniref:hypothetical protein n=1 Tax=Maribacter forsetii TaxID=444515 RepID=UPI00056A929D|nr:hypothetical protein [Maribacter forsetii]